MQAPLDGRSSKFVTVGAIVAVIIATAALTACNTTEGVGKDLESVGEGIAESADKNKS